MTLYDKVNYLQKITQGNYYGERLYAQIAYALSLSKINNNSFDSVVLDSVDFAYNAYIKNCSLTAHDAKTAESILSVLSAEAKSYKAICVSHAHIDMNWMWGFNETASLTVDTFRTVLDLMNEYPEFTFSQSQASTYHIIEEYAPHMLDEIKERVKEGRWEITASTWVETDKNMPNGESLSRHILYTKKYLSDLFDINPDSLEIDFEPDTFGHNAQVPEILSKGGIKYYYHCRGNDKNTLYIFRSQSGEDILSYCDPQFYQGNVYYSMFTENPVLCKSLGVNTLVKVYGIGDHGGGPTRRDISRIYDMMTWPVMPEIKFGTLKEFFKAVEKNTDNLPVLQKEMNFIFTGCYTSQSRIKMANRIAEDRLYESEALCCASIIAGDKKDYNTGFEKAWRKVLFNQFHDILPGSCVIDTREYAMGSFQDAMSYVNISTNTAMRYIASKIKTDMFEESNINDSISEGAGAGFGVGYNTSYRFPQTERGSGKKRVLHLFNTTGYEREIITDVRVWDWDYGNAMFTDTKGNHIAHKYLSGIQHYWGHTYYDFAIKISLPAFGYRTVILDEKETESFCYTRLPEPRDDYINDNPLILENDKIKAVFDRLSMKVTSFIDKREGAELICSDNPSFFFRVITESTQYGMTAWRVGNYIDICDLNATSQIKVTQYDNGGIRKSINYELSFKSSVLKVSIILDEGSSMLDYIVTCDWHEKGSSHGIPQLQFYAPFSYKQNNYKYDIPFGTIERQPLSFDVPANSFATALNQNNDSLLIVTDSKYGFRGYDNALLVDLIRASIDPDPYPEYGIHNIRFSVGSTLSDNMSIYKIVTDKIHPVMFVSAYTNLKGDKTLPPDYDFIKFTGDIRISAIKISEDKKSLIIRLYDANGSGTHAGIKICDKIKSAKLLDITEKHVIDNKLVVNGENVYVDIPPHSMATISIEIS